MRYEQRVNAITDEIKSIQAQLTRYKRERDTYKQMLEGAQKTIAELKTRPRRTSTTSTGKSTDEVSFFFLYKTNIQRVKFLITLLRIV